MDIRVQAAVLLAGALLAACDSIRDVRDDPHTALPEPTAVLKGTITGLGSLRPLALSYNGEPNCFAADPEDPSRQVTAECRFYGVGGQETVGFSFGSLTVGTPYAITVRAQPYGKICTVNNGTGTVGSDGPAPTIVCTDDEATVPRYDLTVNLSPAAQALPNLKVKVATEDKILEADATGMPGVTFPKVLFDSGTSLPQFRFKVTATTDTVVNGETITNYCTFQQTPSFSEGGENINALWTQGNPSTKTDATVVPDGPVTVTVDACSFTVTTTVQYHGTPAMTMPAGGMALALRDHFTGEDLQTLEVAEFTATTPANNPPTIAFPEPLMANSRAIYELVVARQPEGMHCVVAGNAHVAADTTSNVAGMNNAILAPTGSAVLLIDPSVSDWWAFRNRHVRCRVVPPPENRLVGTYQMDAREGMQDTDPPRPWGRPREFLTFFEDGTFLYGINANTASTQANTPNETFPASISVRNNWAASSGVTHGFYAYDPVAQTVTFTVFTSTSINPAGRGITGMPGYATAFTMTVDMQRATGPFFTMPTLATGTVTAQQVTLSGNGDLGTLSMVFSAAAGGVTTTRRWTMTEPEVVPGELTGVWVSEDHRRMFAYDGLRTYAFHIGVNGMGNLQDVCMLPTDDSTQSGGVMTKHAGSATNDQFVFTCTPGIINPGAALVFARTPDLPHYAPKNTTPSGLGIGPTTPQIAPGFRGRFPGTASQLDNRPTSPVVFQVTAGDPDTMTVQDTLNGVPVGQQFVFIRQRVQ